MKALVAWFAIIIAASVLDYVWEYDKDLELDRQHRHEFMAECSKDMKAYECALQWRQSGN